MVIVFDSGNITNPNAWQAADVAEWMDSSIEVVNRLDREPGWYLPNS